MVLPEAMELGPNRNSPSSLPLAEDIPEHGALPLPDSDDSGNLGTMPHSALPLPDDAMLGEALSNASLCCDCDCLGQSMMPQAILPSHNKGRILPPGSECKQTLTDSAPFSSWVLPDGSMQGWAPFTLQQCILHMLHLFHPSVHSLHLHRIASVHNHRLQC